LIGGAPLEIFSKFSSLRPLHHVKALANSAQRNGSIPNVFEVAEVPAIRRMNSIKTTG
jgi:hypothetical protein